VVWLEVSPAEAARRVAHGGGDPAATRPLLAGGVPEERLAALLEARAPAYTECAHLRVPTDGRTPAEVVDDLVARLTMTA
jgi:shikimate kinase